MNEYIYKKKWIYIYKWKREWINKFLNIVGNHEIYMER